MESKLTIGQKIKKFRTKAKLSQLQLETITGASPGSLSRIENGEVNPSKETLAKTIEALKLNIYDASSLFELEKFFDSIEVSKALSYRIEKRGPLKLVNKKKLLKELNNNGKLMGKYKQLSTFIEFENPYLGEVESTKASLSINIIRDLLSDEINCNLKAKTGKMESSLRQEVVIPFNIKDLNQIIGLLSIFNITTGCPRYYYREEYSYKGFNFTIKSQGLAPDHFEIKTNIETRLIPSNQIEVEIRSIIRDLNLRIYTEEEFKNIMLKTYKENPPVKLTSINYILD